MIKETLDAFHAPNLPHKINHYRNDHKYRTDVHCELFRQAENVRFKLPQLEKI